MDVAIHLGAHCTDGHRLQKTLLRNREVLAEVGVAVPEPDAYRAILREAMNGLRGDPAHEDARDVLLEAMGTDDTTERLVLVNPNLMAMASNVVQYGQIYPRIAKARWLRNLFPDSPVAFFLAVRNPATFLPALFLQTGQPEDDCAAFLTGVESHVLRWSDTVVALREACPDCPVTVWCHEDTPLYWADVIHRVAGVRPEMELRGSFDMLRPVMSHEGMKRLRAYTKANPPPNEPIRRRVMTAFLEKFAVPEAIEETAIPPGWSADLVARLSALYEADMQVMASLPGVTLVPDEGAAPPP